MLADSVVVSRVPQPAIREITATPDRRREKCEKEGEEITGKKVTES